MNIKKNTVVSTKEGEFQIKKMKIAYSPITLNQVIVFVVDDNGKERTISEKDVIELKESFQEEKEEGFFKKIMKVFKMKCQFHDLDGQN